MMGLLIAKHLKKELVKEMVKTITDEEKLIEIIKDDGNNFEIRELATKQIVDNDLLKEIIFDTSDTTYTKNNLFDIREIAVKQITNEDTLIEIVNKFYDETVEVKYGLNVVKIAVEGINNEEVLLNIAENNKDEEITNLAVAKINNKHENDDTKMTISYDDDSKVNRMYAIDQIKDDKILLDIAMNAKYLDVREKALNRIKVKDERTVSLNNILLEEKEYNEAINEYAIDEDNNELKQEIIDKANKLGVEYKRMGNTQKEKFYNEQCKLFKDN